MDPKRGDTLCLCVYCGAVFVAELVADDLMALDRLKAKDVFAGQPCMFCFRNRQDVTRTSYRLIIGPLRPPVIRGRDA